MQKYYSIVTDVGTELIAEAARMGKKVNIVSIAAGDGNGIAYQPTSNMTALKREIWRGDILNYEIDGGEDVFSLCEFIAPIIKAIQQQQKMIEQLQKEIEILKG